MGSSASKSRSPPGRARVNSVYADPALLEAIWNSNPLLRHYLGSPDNPQLIVYRITPSRVRYMQEWALDYYDVPFEQSS